MAKYMYTGSADFLTIGNKTYANDKDYRRNPNEYAGSFNDPIPGMTPEIATALIEHSNMHSFTVGGTDLLDVMTAPTDSAPVKDK